jgi:hypothetical protein
MAENMHHNNVGNTQECCLNISKEKTEILARRLLPVIKKFFANEDIREEFEDWKKKRQNE